LILTRPEEENQAWMDVLLGSGLPTVAWPLIDIQAVGDDTDVMQAWRSLSACRAVMFVSRSAVQHFFARRPPDLAWPQQTRAWCTGPGTRRALVHHGCPEACIDAPPPQGPWDTEHLWPVVRAQVQAQDTVMLVRGTDSTASLPGAVQASQGVGRDWLAQQLLNQQVRIRWVVSYRRACPVWSVQRLNDAHMAAQDGSVWVFSSAQALDHLRQLLPHVTWQQAQAVATHARIAQKARDMGFGLVIGSQPTPQALVASLESQP
jgi:uroporphyrinogen-III synthase